MGPFCIMLMLNRNKVGESIYGEAVMKGCFSK